MGEVEGNEMTEIIQSPSKNSQSIVFGKTKNTSKLDV